MIDSTAYLNLAKKYEKSGYRAASLLFYISFFYSSYNSSPHERIPGVVAKIRALQAEFSLSNSQLLKIVHSYGPLSDSDCQLLLIHSIQGSVDGIRSVFCYEN